MEFTPRLTAAGAAGVRLRVDPGAAERGVLVAFSDRRGGVSEPPYDRLNLALRVGDQPEPVSRNRALVARAAGFDADRLVLTRQVHGAELVTARAGDEGVLGEADGLLARGPGPVLGILTADCAPVVLAGAAGIAVVHAGWRGVVAGAVEAGVDAVGPLWGAWIGPSIHSCCYEVGDEVVAAFERRGLPVPVPGRVDPARAAAHILRSRGVPNVFVSDECTHCNPTHFSHRRDGVTGRQGAFVALLEAG
ncbi:MAG: polyphenol oxidase family protein [Actinomycetota bacterium]